MFALQSVVCSLERLFTRKPQKQMIANYQVTDVKKLCQKSFFFVSYKDLIRNRSNCNNVVDNYAILFNVYVKLNI